jgi:hypothetical protein
MICDLSDDEELGQRSATPPSVVALSPSPCLPVQKLLKFEFTVPQITEYIQHIKVDKLFSLHDTTHTSVKCFQLQAPSSEFLTQLQSCAGRAAREGSISIQHWDRQDVYLPFDALGTWCYDHGRTNFLSLLLRILSLDPITFHIILLRSASFC